MEHSRNAAGCTSQTTRHQAQKATVAGTNEYNFSLIILLAARFASYISPPSECLCAVVNGAVDGGLDRDDDTNRIYRSS